MHIVGVTTGVQFERLMINTFRQTGLKVHDTPASNDYGADLIIEYHGHRIAGQCKYYDDRSVGVKAVQEVMGALAYYNCDAGLVITNETFTQQAVNLANANNILLFDENTLDQCFVDISLFAVAFDEFFGDSIRSENRVLKQPEEEWTLNDLVIRYGISQQTIMKNIIAYGLPYYKVGREYRFSPKDVFWWEVDKHYVQYGKNQILALPGYENYRIKMNSRIRKAKKNHDKETVKKLKKQMKSHKVSRLSDKTKDTIALTLRLLPVIALVVYFVYFFVNKKN